MKTPSQVQPIGANSQPVFPCELCPRKPAESAVSWHVVNNKDEMSLGERLGIEWDSWRPLTDTPPPSPDKSMGGTPTTDKEASDGWSGDAVCVGADFARTLERELAQTRQSLAEAEQGMTNEYNRAERVLGERNALRTQLKDLTAQLTVRSQELIVVTSKLDGLAAVRADELAQLKKECAQLKQERDELRLELKPCGDCWLHINAPSGLKASINLGQRGGFNDQTIVGRTIREVAERARLASPASSPTQQKP